MIGIIVGLNLLGGLLLFKKIAYAVSFSVPAYNTSVYAVKSFQKPLSIWQQIVKRYRHQAHLPVYLTEMDWIAIGVIYCVSVCLITLWMPIFWVLKVGISFLLFSVPILALEFRIEFIEHTIDKSLFSFLSHMNACLAHRASLTDVLLDVEMKLDNLYIKEGLRRFNRSVRSGMQPERAFQILNESTTHAYLRYIYLNMEQIHQKNGDMQALMHALECEHADIQVAFNKRKIELKHDRNMTLFSFLLVLLTVLKIGSANDYIKMFYTSTMLGKQVSVILMIGLLAGLGIILSASRIKL